MKENGVLRQDDDHASRERAKRQVVETPAPRLETVPRLGRGICWSDVLAEMERERQVGEAA